MVDEAKVDIAYSMAKDALDRGETITYREVAESLDLNHPIPWRSTQFNWILGAVLERDFEVAANIVTKKDGRPGPGFYEWCDQQGIAYPSRDYPHGKPATSKSSAPTPPPACPSCWMVGPCDCDGAAGANSGTDQR